MTRWTVLAAAALVAGGVVADGTAGKIAGFEPLPYAFDALEPYIDARTMEIHYDRHHRGYYNNLLKAIDGTPWADKSLEEIFADVGKAPAAIRNNAGGHYNHALFWKGMSPQGGGAPEGELARRINASFGSFDAFKTQFAQAATTRFGSGWAWLCAAEDGSLFVTSTPNQDNPLMDVAERRGVPLLGLDVWEHAYYLKYQNLRGDYVAAFWNLVNWPEVAARLPAPKPAQPDAPVQP